MRGLQKAHHRIAETLPQEVLTKMHAPPKNEAIPVLTPAKLEGKSLVAALVIWLFVQSSKLTIAPRV